MSETDQVIVPYWCNVHKISVCRCYGDRLLKLESENKRLREALEKIVKAGSCVECNESSREVPPRHACNVKIAKAALEGK